ncbi:unnamed protein product [Prunus brigantina]
MDFQVLFNPIPYSEGYQTCPIVNTITYKGVIQYKYVSKQSPIEVDCKHLLMMRSPVQDP